MSATHPTYTTRPWVFEQTELETLPTNFFFYGNLRDDALKTGHADPQIPHSITKDFATTCIDATTAKLFQYRLYSSEDAAIAVKTNNDDDFIIGRVLRFDENTFVEAYKRAGKYHQPRELV